MLCNSRYSVSLRTTPMSTHAVQAILQYREQWKLVFARILEFCTAVPSKPQSASSSYNPMANEYERANHFWDANRSCAWSHGTLLLAEEDRDDRNEPALSVIRISHGIDTAIYAIYAI